jgi:hypothetical protein
MPVGICVGGKEDEMDEQRKPRSIRELTEGLRRRGGMLFGHVSRRFDDPEYPHLAGFPVNISFPQLRWPEGLPEHEDDDKPHELFFLCLWPDSETFREDGSTKSLAYFNTWGGPEWIRVIYSKEAARWQVL